MAVVYIWRVIELAYFSSADSPNATREVPMALVLVTCLAAAANIYFGLATQLPTALADAAAQGLVSAVP